MARTNLDKVGTQYRRFTGWLLGEMARKKVDQTTLATYLGVTRATFGHLIHGQSEWRFKQVLELVDYFEADLTEIL